MKKIALLLAMVLCLVPVLSACGTHSSAKSAAVSAFEAYYVDGDAEAFFEVKADYNLDLVKEYIASDKADSMKESIRAKQDTTKESIKKYWDSYTKSEKDGGMGADDVKIDYEVLFVDTYDKKTEMFEQAMENFTYNDTDVEDVVSKVAHVGILVTVTYTIEGEKYTEADIRDYGCFCIDGDWYVD